MSDIKYGLISKVDAATLEKTIDLICNEFQNEKINVTEIGLYNCETTMGMGEYIFSKNRKYRFTGIDNEKDKEIHHYNFINFIKGNSNEVYNQLEDESQHMIVVDGGHAYPTVIADYYCYKSKLKLGGFLCFHDIKPECQGLDWQRMGSEEDRDMFISVRKALIDIGLLNNEWIGQLGWTKVFEEWDENDRCGGFAIFKKIT